MKGERAEFATQVRQASRSIESAPLTAESNQGAVELAGCTEDTTLVTRAYQPTSPPEHNGTGVFREPVRPDAGANHRRSSRGAGHIHLAYGGRRREVNRPLPVSHLECHRHRCPHRNDHELVTVSPLAHHAR